MRTLAALVMLCAGTACFAQADYALEKRQADEITPRLTVGEPLYLAIRGGRKFLALYTPLAPARAAVIVVPGLSGHPDRALIGALRSELAAHGYATLSVQMPMAGDNAKSEDYPAFFPEAAQRLQAAVEFLKSKGHDRIAIVSHDMGGRMTNYYIFHTPDNGVAAWASLSISGGEFSDARTLRLPILDLYGENDLPQVLAQADARAEVLKKLRGSAQLQLAGADHDYHGREADALKAIRAFFDQKFR